MSPVFTFDGADLIDLATGQSMSAGRFSEGNEPWRLKPGESLDDNRPAGVPTLKASDFSTTRDIYELLNLIDNTAPNAGYVELDGDYDLFSFRQYSTGDWRAFANTKKKVMGLFGDYRVTISPTAVADSPGAMEHVLNAPGAGQPIKVVGFYWSNDGSTIPLFLSGGTFRGRLQTPLSVYSTVSQTHFRVNKDTPSPLAWRGDTVWRAIAGSRIQFTRYQGWGYALNSAPPFECGCIDTNYDNGLVQYRNEYHGRVAADIDPTQPLASGGLMWNKPVLSTVIDSWQHDTRRSGFATNTNTQRTDERMYAINFQTEQIANVLDGFAGDNGGFSGSNVEGVVGEFRYDNVYFNVAKGNHINWAVPFSGANGVYVSPTTPVIIVRGFRTDDALYGGCLRISVLRSPNSTGESPVWARVNSLGVEGSNLFDIENAAGQKLIGVKSTAWDSSMTPDTHFVVIY